MGRAIDMESDIYKLKARVDTLENIVRGMTHSMDEMSEKATKTTHIDLVDDVKKEETKNGKKEADSKGDGKSDRADNKSVRNSKKKSSKS